VTERAVLTFREEEKGGRERVTTSEERVLDVAEGKVKVNVNLYSALS